jgi:hypothetical protein
MPSPSTASPQAGEGDAVKSHERKSQNKQKYENGERRVQVLCSLSSAHEKFLKIELYLQKLRK